MRLRVVAKDFSEKGPLTLDFCRPELSLEDREFHSLNALENALAALPAMGAGDYICLFGSKKNGYALGFPCPCPGGGLGFVPYARVRAGSK
jgi:hypothetical protein